VKEECGEVVEAAAARKSQQESEEWHGEERGMTKKER
jgi:hypothetical protein